MKRLALTALLLALPLAAAAAPLAGAIQTGGPTAPDGHTQVACDIPPELCKKNIASKGLGCCVFRSADYLSWYQNVPALHDFPEWMVSKGIEGGGYPEKLADLIPRIAKDRGLPVPEFVQYEGRDPSILELALKTGRPVGVSYNGHDPHYGMGTTIAHMLVLVYLDREWACIKDNNYPEGDQLVWMSRGDFLQRWGGWAVVLLAPRPPNPPRN